MAANVTLLQLRTWARQLSDTENDPNISDTELTSLANRHLTELYDRLVDAGPADYYAATTQRTTSSGVIEYALAADFRNLVDVYVRETADVRRKIVQMPQGARGNYKAPTSEWTVDIEYIPTPPTLTNNSDTCDGVSGWGELIANLMARDAMVKRESDPSVVMNNIARLESRITARSRQRDRSPKRTVDLDDAAPAPWPYGWAQYSRIACYRLRAGNLELYEPVWGYLP